MSLADHPDPRPWLQVRPSGPRAVVLIAEFRTRLADAGINWHEMHLAAHQQSRAPTETEGPARRRYSFRAPTRLLPIAAHASQHRSQRTRAQSDLGACSKSACAYADATRTRTDTMRAAAAFALIMAAPAFAGPVSFGPDQGWLDQTFPGYTPSHFTAQGPGLLQISSDKGNSLIWRPLPRDLAGASDATWRWRVDQGVPRRTWASAAPPTARSRYTSFSPMTPRCPSARRDRYAQP